MAIKLHRFKVYNFRSIEESDWIEVSDNSCLVGTNEAGKTNLLLALWKLNPANDEPIVPLDDFPRHLYSTYKAGKHSEDVFIAADFILDEDYAHEIAGMLNCDSEQVSRVLAERKYDGNHYVSFPYSKVESYPVDRLIELFDGFETSLLREDAYQKSQSDIQTSIVNFINEAKGSLSKEDFKKDSAVSLLENTKEFVGSSFGQKKNLPKLFETLLLGRLQQIIDSFNGKPIQITAEVEQEILKNIPTFVYYSDYGNLDSEIYLPRVIEDFERKDLTESARAKARTLEVLFKYVNLSPKEIYELGNDTKTIVEKHNCKCY